MLSMNRVPHVGHLSPSNFLGTMLIACIPHTAKLSPEDPRQYRMPSSSPGQSRTRTSTCATSMPRQAFGFSISCSCSQKGDRGYRRPTVSAFLQPQLLDDFPCRLNVVIVGVRRGRVALYVFEVLPIKIALRVAEHLRDLKLKLGWLSMLAERRPETMIACL